jgi:hypothetical protein
MKPKFKHDCEVCIFLGHHDDYDLYYHPDMVMDTLIARFGDGGPEYASGIPFYGKSQAITKAGNLAVAAGLISRGRLSEYYNLTAGGVANGGK